MSSHKSHSVITTYHIINYKKDCKKFVSMHYSFANKDLVTL